MSEETNDQRRRFLQTITIAAAQLAMVGSVAAQPGRPKPADLPKIMPGTNASFAALKQIQAGVLNVGYAEAGPPMVQRPFFCTAGPTTFYVDVAPLLASADYRAIVPFLRGYGTTRFLSAETIRDGEQAVIAVDMIALMDERGRAGYAQHTRDFAKLIWQLASPRWAFDEATFNRSAAAFDNPDHVSIVIHNYRWRLGLAEGEWRYDDLEKRLAAGPVITVPSITLEGMPTVRHTRIPVPMPTNAQADMRTGPSPAGSGTTCRRKRPRPLPKRSSTWQQTHLHSRWMLHKLLTVANAGSSARRISVRPTNST